MDLHLYRNSKDRWHDLRAAAREHGAVLAVNALTLDELVQRITPEMRVATPGQRLAVLMQLPRDSIFLPEGETAKRQGEGRQAETPLRDTFPEAERADAIISPRYLYDAVAELKAARVRPKELHAAGATSLAKVLEQYERTLARAGLYDPQDCRVLAASRVREEAQSSVQRFDRVILHALYDLTDAEFLLIQSLIEVLPEGGTIVLFNTTANIKPTQFAEWTWRRFIQDDSLAEKTFPEFCRPSEQARSVLERLFRFEVRELLPPDDSLRIIEATGRYKEVETIASDIADLLGSGGSPNDIAVVVRHIETYGEMLEDVFGRYGIPHVFETGVPLLRSPVIKYWLSMLDLVTNERSREAMARIMSSAYFTPRLSPEVDVERALAQLGYIDRQHLRASALAARKSSPLTAELERFEQFLDALENSRDTVRGFLSRLPEPSCSAERDRQAWRVLLDELETVAVLDTASLPFDAFRKIASEISSLRTVNRPTRSAVAPGFSGVRVVSPNSLGYRDYKWIFAPGFADGEFPARSSSNPLLSDAVIESINAVIRPRRIMNSRDRSRREPLHLFTILDSAAKRVTLTYPGSTLEGEPIYPSVYIHEIARHYAESPIRKASRHCLPRGEGEWLSRIAEEWRESRITDESAGALLGAGIVQRARLDSRGIERAHLGRGVLPLDGVWHPSELNALTACPFVFLARHRLKVRASETPDFEVPAFEIGIFAHTILREFYSQPVPSCIDEARARMNEIITRRLAATDIDGQGQYSVFDPSLWKIRRRQLVSVLEEYASFAVADALDGYETQREFLDAPLPAASMGETTLGGRPDHVAVHRAGGQIDGIRIDDFKYSAASNSTAKQLKQSFQIPVYAYLAAQAFSAEPGVRIEGRYLLLRSPGNPVVSHAIDESVFDDVRMRIDELLTKVREGRMMPDPADRQGCTSCEYRRLCRLYGV